jgi:preprotein translocase subunit YajC
MLMLLATVAPAAANAANAGGPPPPGWLTFLNNFGPLILIAVVLIVLTSGSKRRQERERKNLLDNLKKGDRVKLFGGEFGAVVDVKDTKVLLKVDEGSNTKIWYAREAVASVEKEETPK